MIKCSISPDVEAYTIERWPIRTDYLTGNAIFIRNDSGWYHRMPIAGGVRDGEGVMCLMQSLRFRATPSALLGIVYLF
jgi:hypothetical protein